MRHDTGKWADSSSVPAPLLAVEGPTVKRKSMCLRALGPTSTIYAGCLPVGLLVVGPACDLVPLRAIMAVTGALSACLAAILFRHGPRD